MWKGALLLGLLVGCGGKTSRDCDGYAAKVTELSDPVPEQRDMVMQVSRDACTSGRVPDAEIACAKNAPTRAALIRCTTTGSASTPPQPPPPKPGPSAKISLLAAVNGGDLKPLDPDGNADQRAWLDELRKAVASCAIEEKFEPQEFVVVVTYGAGLPAVTPGNLPPQVGTCVVPLLSKAPPSSVKKGPVEFYVEVGK